MNHHGSGIPAVAFPLHTHVYTKFVGRGTDRAGNSIVIHKCCEPFCGATDTKEG